jgi:predicted O-methyltransferase YrrM
MDLYMAHRGRPRKKPLPNELIVPDIKRGRGRPRKSPISNSHEDAWANALALSSTISDHYAIEVSEQQLLFHCALAFDPGSIIVELGVTHGRTAAILCYAAKLQGLIYYGVDNFTLEGNAKDTQANLDRLDLPFNLLVGDTQSVPFSQPIDFLIVDAGHDVVNITQDCQRWLPMVKPGGIVAFHAYNPSIDQTDPHWGIKNCVDVFCGTWEKLVFIEWLLIKRKPLL